jgi:hypothetical protein
MFYKPKRQSHPAQKQIIIVIHIPKQLKPYFISNCTIIFFGGFGFVWTNLSVAGCQGCYQQAQHKEGLRARLSPE